MQQPDLSIVEPETEGSMIKVGQIRSLQHSLSLTPYEARYRVALLLNFQYANPSAQNALLKTLEEAPTQVILLLTADSADNLLPTIASRCEILRLRPVAVETLSDALQTHWKVPLKEARLYASLSNGRAGLARRMVLDPSILEKRRAWLDELLRLLPLNRCDRFAAVDTLTRQRDQLRLVLQAWFSFARDLLLVSIGLTDRVTNIDLLDEIKVYAGKMDSGQPLELVNALSRALEYVDLNANLRLVMDNLVLEIPRLR
jgi:DNA polymerase-3 subunit delta'